MSENVQEADEFVVPSRLDPCSIPNLSREEFPRSPPFIITPSHTLQPLLATCNFREQGLWCQHTYLTFHLKYGIRSSMLRRMSHILCPQRSGKITPYRALLTNGAIVHTRDLLSLRSTLQSYNEGKGTFSGRVDIIFDNDIEGDADQNYSKTYLPLTVHALRDCASSLRIIDWTASDDNAPDPRILRQFEVLVKDLPKLRILNLPGLRQWADGTITNSTLTSVHTLCLRDLIEGFRYREQETGDTSESPRTRLMEEFLHHYGPHLTSVQLRAIGDPELISVYLPMVKQTHADAFSAPIEYLGLSIRRLQCRAMFETCSLLFLSLKRMQLLDQQIVEDLLRYNLPVVSDAVEQGLIGDAFRWRIMTENPLSVKVVEAQN
ncbi:hypothetical protein BKA82DRAFT_4214091 [Pisolithus tinctorius]|nr:hypothetical protein BKA82DRAFT_4214091 [Pisolithus tinctorius]